MFYSLIAFLKRHLLSRENLWAIILAVLLLLLIIMATGGAQPRFVYGGF